MTAAPVYDVVIPTVGRSTLPGLVAALTASDPPPGRVVVADDRAGPRQPLHLPAPSELVRVVTTAGRGPAAARNAGWCRTAAAWVVFLDDDVVVPGSWAASLACDLAAVGPEVGASQGRVTVPRPPGRLLTDAERNVVALEGAAFITADMAVRRTALRSVGGFDERFRRAFREDTDLALRLLDAGWRIASGRRQVQHPLRQGTWTTSIRAQRGNADDALMRRLHGPDWRRRGRVPAGALGAHQATTIWLLAAGVAALGRRPRLAAVPAAAATGRIAELAWKRAAGGPRQPREWSRMAISSAAIPAAATGWALTGTWRARRLAPAREADRWGPAAPDLVLFDRDGTLVVDVPYNGDPAAVAPMPGARAALDRLRAANLRVGLITNQSGVGRGWLDADQVAAVNERVVELLGPFDTLQVCPHAPGDGCGCRKPQPGMVLAAANQFGIAPERCAVVGDIGADVEAALAAGARAILVPRQTTLACEIARAPEVADDLDAAVGLLLDQPKPAPHPPAPVVAS